MNVEQLIKTVKVKLGNNDFIGKITDEMYRDLLSEAYNQFSLFSRISKGFSDEELDSMAKLWVGQYFHALVKECVGNIIINLNSNNFDHLFLLKESESEKTALKKILFPKYEYENKEEIVLIAVYLGVGSLDKQIINELSEKLSKDFLNSLPHFVKTIIIPIREGQSRVELVFSNDKNMNIENVSDLYNQFKDLDSAIDKYFPKNI